MYVLPALPPTIAIPLDAAGMPGCIAHARPLDANDVAAWFDRFADTKANHVAAVVLVREQVVDVEGFAIDEGTGAPVPFDPTKPVHLRSLPRAAHHAIYNALIGRAGLSSEQKKSSASPADSTGARDGDGSPAAAAASSSATNTTADSPAVAATPT